MKACRKCGLEKPNNCEIFVNIKGKPGRICQDCHREYCKSYYAANREKMLQGFRDARKSNPDLHRARDGEYYRKHIDKKKEGSKRYREANPDRVRQSLKDWCKRNPERVAEYGVAHRAKYKEKIYARQLRWISDNKDHVRALSRKNYHANIERTTEYYRQWREKNRSRLNELARAQYQKDKAKVKAAKHQRRIGNGSGISFTKTDLDRILEEQCGTCRYCDTEISEKYEIDHFIPIARGGGNEPENIVLACMPCNRSKGARLPWVWRPDLFT